MDTKDDLKQEYDELMVKLDLMEKEARDPSDSNREELFNKRDEVKSKWEMIKDASGDAWDEAKDGFKLALDELREAYNDVTD